MRVLPTKPHTPEIRSIGRSMGKTHVREGRFFPTHGPPLCAEPGRLRGEIVRDILKSAVNFAAMSHSAVTTSGVEFPSGSKKDAYLVSRLYRRG